MQADFRELVKPSDRPIIYVDDREPPDMVEYIKEWGGEPKVKRLDLGDYIISERAVVERKTRSDFENSIIDGRLFDQASRLTEEFERVVIVIEGETFEGRINRRALLGAISALYLDMGINVFFTRDTKASAEIITAMARREQMVKKRKILLKGPKKSKDPYLQKVYVVSSLPMIGERLAERLLERFGSVRSVFNATEQDLASVEGLGKKRAREIVKFLTEIINGQR